MNHWEQMKILNYFYKLYVKLINIIYFIYLSRGATRKLMSKIQTLFISVLGYFKDRLSLQRLFVFISG